MPASCGDVRLDEPARLQHAGDLADRNLDMGLYLRGRHRLGPDEDAATGTRFDAQRPGVAEHGDRVPKGGAADAHGLGEGPLRGQTVADSQIPGEQRELDLFDRVLQGPACLDALRGPRHLVT